MTENAMIRALAANVQAGVPTMIWGMPGESKTAKVTALAAAWGRTLETIVASAHESVDFTGLPVESDGGMVDYSPLRWAVDLAGCKSGLLFIDEFTTAGSAQKALLRIVNEGFVGKVELGEHVSVVAAANPPEVAVDGIDLAAPTANRFIHLDWVFDLDEWLIGVGTNFEDTEHDAPSTYLAKGGAADRARATQIVTGFLRARPELARQYPTENMEQQGKAWASPRSWTNVIKALSFVRADDEDARDLIVRGAVGDAIATEFLAWVAANDLEDPSAVLADPTIVEWSSIRPDRAFALLSGVQALVAIGGSKDAWSKGLEVAATAARGGRPDTAIPFARYLSASGHARDGITESFRDAFDDLFTRLGAIQA